jgi:hypothetical protein
MVNLKAVDYIWIWLTLFGKSKLRELEEGKQQVQVVRLT